MRVAIVGGGQLARMIAMAGMAMGVRCSFLVEKDESISCVDGLGPLVYRDPAWGAEEILAALGHPEVVTIERESVDVGLLREIATRCPVHPQPEAVATLQHRHKEKDLVAGLSLATAPYRTASDAAEIVAAVEALGLPLVVKACRDGYDGKGQYRLSTDEEVAEFCDAHAGGEWLLEKKIPFDREVSLLGARSSSGEVAFYPLTENHHHEGILVTSMAPAAGISKELAQRAEDYLEALMDGLDYVGVIAMECFLLGDELLVNELAPRVHNSGHWTLRGNASSQFENHLRAILGMPLGNTDLAGCAGIVNILGDYNREATLRRLPARASLVDYNKSAAPRRKLGHVLVTGSSHDQLSRDLQSVQENLA